MTEQALTKSQSNLGVDFLTSFIKRQQSIVDNQDSFLQNQSPQIAQGKWEQSQNLKFTIFIDFYCKIFASKQRRKSEKIFKILSTYMGNRTPAQCRSHYQKMIMKFKTIAKLKKHFKQNYGQDLYNESFKKFSEQKKHFNLQNSQNDSQSNKKQVCEIAVQTEQFPIDYFQLQQFMFYNQMQPIYSQFNANYSVLYQVGEHLLQ